MKKIVIIIGILSVFLCSCDTKKVFEENIKIEKGIWDNQKKATFEVLISDTLAVHNVFVNIRNTDLYQYSNIYLFIKTSSPDGYFLRDTFDCVLADLSGKWLGDGMGDIWDNQILYKKNVRFPVAGIYTFEFEQAMRMRHLPFIMDIGLRVETID
ncbi:MAG: gliding motility lipoprotein GldH [Bacteroidetes bacterium]|jgi:gliding motility-associated lipoprotein GldH|nr:gliding motility lipoprotein GldH [Bacteroidota bacterium]MBT6684898.1 gliding motility lipoprotein GldH [Bacteroidota bacterium]MBT7143321.1 gliding motility lipoprotein GldH [Bacteroidota bacterium]MBT7493419.1 gliding motility lipoprotein GldH [Bacteroidota bacterium]